MSTVLETVGRLFPQKELDSRWAVPPKSLLARVFSRHRFPNPVRPIAASREAYAINCPELLLHEPELVSNGRANDGDATFLACRRELRRIVARRTKLVKRDEEPV
jgi:hypothetical protein